MAEKCSVCDKQFKVREDSMFGVTRADDDAVKKAIIDGIPVSVPICQNCFTNANALHLAGYKYIPQQKVEAEVAPKKLNMLRVILSLTCGILGGFLAAILAVEQMRHTGGDDETIFIWFIIGSLVSYYSSYVIFEKVPTFTKIFSSAISYSKDVSEGIKVAPEFYAVAEQEILENDVDKGLWAKALVNAKGNEDARKAEYIKLRARKLQKES